MRARLQNTYIVRSMMVALLLMSTPVAARDPEGKYAQADPEMHRWFEQLKSEGGEACCALSDGNTLRDRLAKQEWAFPSLSCERVD